MPLKCSGKTRQRIKPCFTRDFCNTVIGMMQQVFSEIQPCLRNKLLR